MAWCPKCKCNYPENVEQCEECKVELISGKDEDYELLLTDHNEECVLMVYNYLNDTTNYTTELFTDYDNEVFEIYALKDEAENIKKAIVMFLEDELETSNESIDDIVDSFEKELNKDEKSATYVSAKDKYEERRSSAFSTFTVGVLGLIYTVLNYFGYGIITSNEKDIYAAITMAIVFGTFTIIGVVTHIHSKKLKNLVTEEETIIENLKKFFAEEITAEGIDKECDFTDEEDALIYFARQNCIKEKIYKKFDIKDETLVDQIIDEYYPKIFEEQ